MAVFERNDPQALMTIAKRLACHQCSDGSWIEPPTPDPKVVASLLGPAAKRLISTFGSKRFRPLSDAAFLAMCAQHNKKYYVQACESLTRRRVRRADAMVKWFLKRERYNRTLKANPVNRLISPRTWRYAAALGKYTRAVEHFIYHKIDVMFGLKRNKPHKRVVFKGLNAKDRGDLFFAKWSEFSNPVFVGLDCEHFDKFLDAVVMKYEHEVICALFSGKDREEVRRLLSWQKKYRGMMVLKRLVLYILKSSSRCSGDMNTSLGNIIVMCLACWSYLRNIREHWEFVDDGDDAGIIIEKEHAAKLQGLVSHFTKLGMRLKLEEPVDILERVEFCSSCPIKLGDGSYTMVRKYPDAVAKDTTWFNDSLPYAEWCHAVGTAGNHAWSDIPIYGSFYRCLQRLGTPGGELPRSNFVMATRGIQARTECVSDETRVSFYKAFGVGVDEQIAIEEEYDKTIGFGKDVYLPHQGVIGTYAGHRPKTGKFATALGGGVSLCASAKNLHPLLGKVQPPICEPCSPAVVAREIVSALGDLFRSFRRVSDRLISREHAKDRISCNTHARVHRPTISA